MHGLHNISLKGRVYHRALPISEPGPLHWMIVDPEARRVNSLSRQERIWVSAVRDYLMSNNAYCQYFQLMAEGGPHADAVEI